jgi:hypothetical protein
MKTNFTRIVAIATLGLIAICASASLPPPRMPSKANLLCLMMFAGPMPRCPLVTTVSL